MVAFVGCDATESFDGAATDVLFGTGLSPDDDRMGVVEDGRGCSEGLELRDPAGDPDVNARSLASLSCNDAPAAVPSLLDLEALCSFDLPGAITVGAALRRATAGSEGRLCSSIKARGACLICVALLFSCLVGTDRAAFLFGALKIVFFFREVPAAPERGICGRSKDQAGAPIGSVVLSPDFGEAKTGAMPPIFLSYDA